MIKKILLNNLIKESILKKKRYLIIDLNKKDLRYLNLFLSLNLISFIKKIKNKFLIYFNKNVFNIKVKNIYKPSKKIIISYKELNKIVLKKRKIFFISNDLGIILSNKAVFSHKGGLILLELKL